MNGISALMKKTLESPCPLPLGEDTAVCNPDTEAALILDFQPSEL